MLIANLPIEKILSFFLRRQFPFSQKTFLVSKEYDTPIGIFTPHYNGENRHWVGSFLSLLKQDSFDRTITIEISPSQKNKFYVKQTSFPTADSWTVTYTAFLSGLEFQSFYTRICEEKPYTTLLISNLFLKKIPPYIHCFKFAEHSHYPIANNYRIKTIAFIYDPKLEKSFQEINAIQKTLKTYFSSFLTISIFTSPLDHIFNSHDIIHYAGHIGKKGIFGQLVPSLHKTSHNPKIVFFNGCSLPSKILKYFSTWDTIFIFSDDDQIDHFIPINDLRAFYLGLFIGLRLKDLSHSFPSNIKILGYAHIRLSGFLDE